LRPRPSGGYSQELGFAGMANGALLARLEGNFEVFVTADKNLRYQQNLAGRSLAIVELPTNRLPILTTMTAEIVSAVIGYPRRVIRALKGPDRKAQGHALVVLHKSQVPILQ